MRHRRSIWFELPAAEGFVAAYRIVAKRRKPIVAEVRLFPEEGGRTHGGRWSGDAAVVPEGGIPGKALRALRLKDPMQQYPEILANLQRRHGADAAKRLLDEFALSRRSHLVPRRPGRKGRSDEFYAVWAVAYVGRLKAGSRRPVKDLAMTPPIHIRGHVSDAKKASEDTVRDIIHEARARGFLTAAPEGKAGGELTPRAERVLRKAAT